MRRWYEMRAGAGNSAPEIMIYDEIGKSWFGDETMSATDFARELKALGDVPEITLRINSPGGDVYDGLAIHNLIAQHPARITARIDGIAASAASLIAMAADEIVMPENAFMLIHEPCGMAMGTSDTLLSVAADLARMTESFTNVYVARSGRSSSEIAALMKEDRLMLAPEAKAMGFCDVLGGPTEMTASYSFDRLPPEARALVSAIMRPRAALDPEKPMDPEKPKDPVMADPEETPEATRDQKIADYCRQIIDLCNLADQPQMASDFVAKQTPLADVRRQLMAAKAAVSDLGRIVGAHAGVSTPVPSNHGWDDVVAKVNQSNGRGRG